MGSGIIDRGDLSLLIATLALGISMWAVRSAKKTAANQSRLAMQQLQLTRWAAAEKFKANIVVSLVRTASDTHRFVVFNRGPGEARHVRLDPPASSEGGSLLSGSHLVRLFPVPVMKSGQKVATIAKVHLRTRMPCRLRVEWENEDGTQGSQSLSLS